MSKKRFPQKAVDLNELPDRDGFWNMTVEQAQVLACLSLPQPKTMADMIFWLNMAAICWEEKHAKKNNE